jgi:hypothetical protein
MKPIPLTARQIEWVDKINHDKKAVKDSQEMALMHFENRLSELEAKRLEFWDEMKQIHELGEFGDCFTIKTFEGGPCIVVVDDD